MVSIALISLTLYIKQRMIPYGEIKMPLGMTPNDSFENRRIGQMPNKINKDKV